jgi:hypothetical protein
MYSIFKLFDPLCSLISLEEYLPETLKEEQEVNKSKMAIVIR